MKNCLNLAYSFSFHSLGLAAAAWGVAWDVSDHRLPLALRTSNPHPPGLRRMGKGWGKARNFCFCFWNFGVVRGVIMGFESRRI